MLNEKKVQDSTFDVHGFSADDGNADTGNKLPRQWEACPRQKVGKYFGVQKASPHFIPPH